MLEMLIVAAIGYIVTAMIMISRRRARMGPSSYHRSPDQNRDTNPRDQFYFYGG